VRENCAEGNLKEKWEEMYTRKSEGKVGGNVHKEGKEQQTMDYLNLPLCLSYENGNGHIKEVQFSQIKGGTTKYRRRWVLMIQEVMNEAKC
jgi:hypothetical protein